MKIVISACHKILHSFCRREKSAFQRQTIELEKTQRRIWREVLHNSQAWSARPHDTNAHWADWPITPYTDMAEKIDRKALNVRWVPTSGSTSARKWIPYTSAFQTSLTRAASLWMADLYERYPIRSGTHYWSMSWVPTDLRNEVSSEDTKYLSNLFSQIMQPLLAMPHEVEKVETSEASWWAQLCYLASRQNLQLISVWSPTYLLRILDDLEQNWDEIEYGLRRGIWSRHRRDLEGHLVAPRRRDFADGCQLYAKLWPELALVSAWDSATSRSYFSELQRRLPGPSFQGKGLWATEGVVTVPFEEKKVLAYRSHFYEFRRLESDRLIPAWELNVGDEVQPYLWTQNGFFRYPLEDRLRVTGHLNEVPCFEFLGRLGGTDLVGEKLDVAFIDQLIEASSQRPSSGEPYCFVARRDKPGYVLYWLTPDISTAGESTTQTIAKHYEAELARNFHYNLARDLGQLTPLEVRLATDWRQVEEALGQRALAGQTKIERLREVNRL